MSFLFTHTKLKTLLLLLIIGVTGLIILLSTGVQLYLDYHKKIRDLESNFQFISDSYLSPLSSSLWDFNEDNVRLQLQGILKLPGIKFCSISDDTGLIGTALDEGDAESRKDIMRQFPLTYREKPIGLLTVYANFDHINKELLRDSTAIFISYGCVVLGIAFTILVISNYLLFKHFAVIAAYTDNIDIDHLDKPLILKRQEKNDEIQQIVNAINEMRLRIQNSIIERQKMEEALKTRTDFLDKVIESAALSTWISDETGTAIRANPACLEFFGAATGEFIGKYNLFQDSVIKKSGFMPELQGVFDKGRTANIVIDYDFKAVKHVNVKNATRKIINSIFTPIMDDNGKVSNVIVQTIDLTDIKRMERELNQALKMESIGNLAGGIAHDFNNILASIIGFTELALDEAKKDTTLDDSLQEVYKAANRAKALVKQILAFARQSEAQLKPIQPGLIAKEVLKFIRSTIPATIDIKHALDSDALIMGNATQVHQLIMNLCTNAAHAMEAQGGIIEVTLKDITADKITGINKADLKYDDYIELKVADTGEGIAPDVIDSIFEPYFTTKGPGEGTGMGLAMVQGIVSTYEGHISVDSKKGKGSIFKLYFPITRKRKAKRAYVQKELPRGTERVLFVDDEAPIAKIGSQILERLGYTVTTRTSSIEAMELVKSKPNAFDLVVTDMTMPNITGDQLAIELLKIRPDIPIILCTGYSNKVSEENAKKIGINAFAYKPIVKADLAQTVRKVIDDAKGR